MGSPQLRGHFQPRDWVSQASLLFLISSLTLAWSDWYIEIRVAERLKLDVKV